MNRAVRYGVNVKDAVNTAIADIAQDWDASAFDYSQALSDHYMESYDSYVDQDDPFDRETFDWLQDPANRLDENYSDIFKDFYGFRPRF